MKLQQESAAHDSDKTSNTRGPRARPPRVDRLESKLHSLGVYKPASSTWTCHLWSLVPTRSASTDSTKFLAGVARLHTAILARPCTRPCTPSPDGSPSNVQTHTSAATSPRSLQPHLKIRMVRKSGVIYNPLGYGERSYKNKNKARIRIYIRFNAFLSLEPCSVEGI